MDQCCNATGGTLSSVTITGGTAALENGFTYNGDHYYLGASSSPPTDLTLDASSLYQDYCETQVTCPLHGVTLESCCDNITGNTRPNASIPNNYTTGMTVSLDGVCYSINGYTADTEYTATTVVSYSSCTACVSSSATTDCAYSVEACYHTDSSNGEVMAFPHKFNIQLNEILTGTVYRSYGWQITNSNSQVVTLSNDCYNIVTSAFTPSLTYETPTSSSVTSDCSNGGKCELVNVALRHCEDGQTRLAQASWTIANGLSSGTTVSSPALNGGNKWYPSMGQGVTGTCNQVVGKVTSINSTQTNGQTGTDWSLSTKKYEIVTGCTDNDCGCRSNFTINNTSATQHLVSYRLCDGTLVSNTILPGGGSINITNCVNVNSIWRYAALASPTYWNNITITGSYNNC